MSSPSRALCALVVLATAMPTSAALAQDAEPFLVELRAGLLLHDADGLWASDRRESGTDYNLEAVFHRVGPDILAGRIRPHAGFSLNNQGESDTSQVYAGLHWEREWDSGVFVNLGLGGAWHDGKTNTRRSDRKELGTRLLFRVPIELGLALGRHHRVSLAFAHVSNAGFDSDNEGLDTLGVRYGYRF